LTSPDGATPGNGLLLLFRVDNFDVALSRGRAMGSRLEEEPHVNPSTGTMDFSLRDPDSYHVSISAPGAAPLASQCSCTGQPRSLIRRDSFTALAIKPEQD
jgi:hypothetical protein